jgi:hypothetical protein
VRVVDRSLRPDQFSVVIEPRSYAASAFISA